MVHLRVSLPRAIALLRSSPLRQSPPIARAAPLRPSAYPPTPFRCYATEQTPSALEVPDYLNEAERKIFDTIRQELQPTKLEVQDISGGCGSMYALDIVSEQFKGLPVIKQHRLVNKVLGEEIKKWHGVQLKTKAP
ncbi:hypothetical protein LTR08_006642 [Meristemomyces frigidus]|nr:hypothetical protein LTR08_006642 [Meristemomyces frigidus]